MIPPTVIPQKLKIRCCQILGFVLKFETNFIKLDALQAKTRIASKISSFARMIEFISAKEIVNYD